MSATLMTQLSGNVATPKIPSKWRWQGPVGPGSNQWPVNSRQPSIAALHRHVRPAGQCMNCINAPELTRISTIAVSRLDSPGQGPAIGSGLVTALAMTSERDLTAGLAGFAAGFEEVLGGLLPAATGVAADLPEAMAYAVSGGGKYLRPYLLSCSAEMFDVPAERILHAGSAVEVIHAYSLVHDDLPSLDNDDLRRGRPTCHRAFGEATALLAGDGLLTLAFEILASRATHPDPEVRVQLVGALAGSAGARGMVEGQVIDLACQHRDVGFATAETLARKKTGALFSFSASAGAILGKAGAECRRALEAFGSDLGLAFQIVDDLLDVDGDETVVGKRVGKDSDAGKATFVAVLGLEEARAELDRVSAAAISRLEMFGGKANRLRGIVNFVATRNR